MLADKLRNATTRLEEIEQKATEKISTGIGKLTDAIQGALHDMADRLNPSSMVNVSKPRNAQVKQSGGNNYTYAFIASGVVAAAAYALYKKKNDKDAFNNTDKSILVNQEIETI